MVVDFLNPTSTQLMVTLWKKRRKIHILLEKKKYKKGRKRKQNRNAIHFAKNQNKFKKHYEFFWSQWKVNENEDNPGSDGYLNETF